MSGTAERTPPAPVGHAVGLRWLLLPGLLLLVLALLGLALRTSDFVQRGWLAIASPFGIDYGEGIVWQQALLMHPGAMYGPIDHLPYIVFHYPPLYHLSALSLSALTGADILATGRTLSVLCTLGIALLVGRLAWRNAGPAPVPGQRATTAMVAASGLFGFWPIYGWGVLMRVDMLAALCSLIGVSLGIAALRRPGFLYAAMVAFVAAIFSKQTELVAPVSVLVIHLLRAPRLAIRAALFGLVVALAALAAVMWASDGGFLRHIVGYNINRMTLEVAQRLLGTQVTQLPLVVVAMVGMIRAWQALGLASLQSRLRADPKVAELCLLTLVPLLQLPMLSTIGKSGGNVNYFLGIYIALAPFVGIAAGHCLRMLVSGGISRLSEGLAELAVPALILVQLTMGYRPPNNFAKPAIIARNQLTLERFRATPGPILADDMVTLLRAGKRVELEPSIFAELGAKGVWDSQRLVDLITAHHFALIQTDRRLDSPVMLTRYTPEVRAAIEREYPVVEQEERRFLYSPAR